MSFARSMLKSKIHRAIVTQAELHYEGSITIPPDLMEAAKIAEYEHVHVWNVTRGTRFETYAITGVPGSHDICVNGAAAHLADPGNRVIIATFVHVAEEDIQDLQPALVFVQDSNQHYGHREEVPGPLTR